MASTEAMNLSLAPAAEIGLGDVGFTSAIEIVKRHPVVGYAISPEPDQRAAERL